MLVIVNPPLCLCHRSRSVGFSVSNCVIAGKGGEDSEVMGG
jgi:hypothetical protein